MHPNYDDTTFINDVCVIKTVNDLALDGNSRNMACLPDNRKQIPANDGISDTSSCFIAGWGMTQAVEPKYMSAPTVRSHYGYGLT